MWDKRLFLFLLKTFQSAQQEYMTTTDYGNGIVHGFDDGMFTRFCLSYWGIIPCILFFIKLRRVPEKIRTLDQQEIRHIHYDFVEKHIFIREELLSAGLIFVGQRDGHKTLRINYAGQRFIKFFPFYKALIGENGPIFLTVGGIFGILFGTYPYIVHFFSTLLALW